MDAHLRGKAPEAATSRDPVCGMEAPLSRSAGEAAYRGVAYRFFSRECHMKFQADPGPYVDAPEVA